MDIRRLFLILATVVSFTFVWAQTELEEPSQPDTLNIQTVVIDTLEEKVDPEILLVEMNNFLAEKRINEDNLFLPHLIYKENFHLNSPFDLNMRIKKNGFSEIPFATGNIQTVQNNRSIYKTIYTRGNIFYSSWEYSLPAAITETYMGLGDNDMNNIAVSLMKGGIFGIQKFDIQLDYLGEKGKWLGGVDEASRNFHLHLVYDLDFAKLHFENSIIDQELPGEKDIDGYVYAPNSTSYKDNEYSVLIQNLILDLGLKYKISDYTMNSWFPHSSKLFRKERTLVQFLAHKKIQIPNHKLDVSYEFVAENISTHFYSTLPNTARDDSYHILSFDHDSSLLGFNLGNTGRYRNENNFQLNSEITKKIFNGFSLLGEYVTSLSEHSLNHFYTLLEPQTTSRIGGGILINPSNLELKVVFGQNTYENSQSEYFELQNMLDVITIKRLQLNIISWLRKSMDCNNYELEHPEILSYPEWQMSNLIEITYHLRHYNAIMLGIKHFYHSDYSFYLGLAETPYQENLNSIDAYLKLQITKRFEISIDAINITNNERMYTQWDWRTHFNFNVHWIFAN